MAGAGGRGVLEGIAATRLRYIEAPGGGWLFDGALRSASAAGRLPRRLPGFLGFFDHVFRFDFARDDAANRRIEVGGGLHRQAEHRLDFVRTHRAARINRQVQPVGDEPCSWFRSKPGIASAWFSRVSASLSRSSLSAGFQSAALWMNWMTPSDSCQRISSTLSVRRAASGFEPSARGYPSCAGRHPFEELDEVGKIANRVRINRHERHSLRMST